MSTIAAGRPRALKRRKSPEGSEKLTVGQYLLKRLAQIGASHLFLTPHPYLKHFSETIDRHPKISLVTNPSIESCAEMADGYGKAKGISAMAIHTSGTEALPILMRASSESVPLVLIFGTSQKEDRIENHFSINDRSSLLEKLLRQFSSAWTELSDPQLAAKKIDRVLDYCLFFKKPVCIELPQEVVDRYIPQHHYQATEFGRSDPGHIDEVLLELDLLLTKSRHPLIHLERDCIAQKAEAYLLHFAERWHIPITSSYLAKTFLLEAHPHYCGTLTEELLARTDLFFVIGSPDLPAATKAATKGHKVQIASDHVAIDHRIYPQLLLKEVLLALCSLEPHRRPKIWQTRERPDSLLEDVIICSRDAELLEDMSHYFSGDSVSSNHTSPHYSLAAAIGASKALPSKRPIVILDEQDLRASLSELYMAHEECIPLLVCVVGNGSWVKGLFPDVPVYRRKIPEILPYELVVISLE